MRPWIMSFALMLILSSAWAENSLPVATISDQAHAAILEQWNGLQPLYQAEVNKYPVTAPARGYLLAVYLDKAFELAGYSLDKTFLLWFRKINNGSEIAQYPDLHQFAASLGFVSIMTYLTDIKDPSYRDAMLGAEVFSQETIIETAPEGDPLNKNYTGNAKPDDYQ